MSRMFYYTQASHTAGLVLHIADPANNIQYGHNTDAGYATKCGRMVKLFGLHAYSEIDEETAISKRNIDGIAVRICPKCARRDHTPLVAATPVIPPPVVVAADWEVQLRRDGALWSTWVRMNDGTWWEVGATGQGEALGKPFRSSSLGRKVEEAISESPKPRHSASAGGGGE